MNEDEIQATVDKIQAAMLILIQSLLKFVFKLGQGLIIYAFLSYVFLWIYAVHGFEQTIIILGVGIISFAIKK